MQQKSLKWKLDIVKGKTIVRVVSIGVGTVDYILLVLCLCVSTALSWVCRVTLVSNDSSSVLCVWIEQ